MFDYSHNSENRYGDSVFASYEDLRKAGYFRQGGIPVGYYQDKVLNIHGDGPLCLVSGSGSGKLTSVLGRIVCAYPERQFILCLKGELSKISVDSQWRHNKHHWFINPFRLHGLPSHTVNFISFLRADSPTLTSDCKLVAEFLIVNQVGSGETFFPDRAREWIAKLLEWQVLKQGETDLIRFNSLINAIDGNLDIWSATIAEGENHQREDIKRTFNEMKYKQINAPKEFGGVMGVIYNALDFLSDHNIARTVGGGDFTLDVLCDPSQKANISLIVPAENIDSLGGFMRLAIGITALHKSRNPA